MANITPLEICERVERRVRTASVLIFAALCMQITPAHAQATPKTPDVPPPDPRIKQVTPAPANIGTAEPKPAFEFKPRGVVDFTYTNNVLVTNTDKKPDVIVSSAAGFTLTGDTARTTYSIDSDAHYDEYIATKRLSGLRVTGRATANTDIVDQLLSINARAATDQQRIDPFNGTPASTRSFGGNQSQILNYGATPKLNWRFGNFASVVTTYDVSLVNYLSTAGAPVGGAPSALSNDSVQQSVRANVDSGSLFDRLTWNAQGSILRQEQSNSSTSSDRREIEGSLLYELMPNLKVVGTGGYDDIKESTLPGLRGGVHVTGGVRWTLSRRTSVTFDAGRRYRSPYYSGLATYSPGQSIKLRTSYSESVDTPQGLAIQNLGGLVRDNLGNLIDPISGLPSDPNNNPFGQNNQAFLRKALEVGIEGTLGRNRYNISGTHERRISTATSTSLKGSVGVGRQLSQSLRAGLTLSYDKISGGVVARTSETLRANTALDYTLGASTTASLTYYFQRIDAAPTRTREHAVVLKLKRDF